MCYLTAYVQSLFLTILFSVNFLIIGYSAAPQAILYGSNLENTLNLPGDIHQYSLEGKAGDVIWLRTKDAASPVDASFRFLDSKGHILKKVSGSGGLVELFGYVLPADDVYSIEIFDNQANDAGRYALALHKLNQPTYAYGLVCGEDATHSLLMRCAANAYSFNADANEIINLQVRGANPAMEADMILLNAAGDVVSKAQIFNKNYAGWSPITIPATGVYTVFFFDRGGNDTGDYGISIQSLTLPNCNAHLLSCQSAQSVQISQLAEQHAYLFEHQNGRREVLLASAQSPSLELSLQLFNDQGHIVSHQISSGKLNELWIDPQLASGQYLVVISDDRANDFSTYHMYFHTVDGTCTEQVNTCQVIAGALEQRCGVVHYQFSAEPGTSVSATVKEIDAAIEPIMVLLDGDYQQLGRAGHSEKAILANLTVKVGGTLHLLVFDQGGNDLGRFKVEWLQSGENQASGPVAVCKPQIAKTLENSKPIKLTASEIDNGSYDPCGPFVFELSKSSFSCADVGEQEVVMTIKNEAGRKNSCTTRVTIISDLKVEFPTCAEVFPAYAPAACAKLNPTITGGVATYRYLWNDLSTAETLATCPAISTPYLVTVTDANGCTSAAEILVEAIDISCGNNKVYVCHLPEGQPENAQTICISPSAVDQHLAEHEGCSLGACGSVACISSSNIWYAGRSQLSSSISSPALLVSRGQQVMLPLKDLAPEVTSGSWVIHVVNTWGQPLAELEVDALSPSVGIEYYLQGGNILFMRCFHQDPTGTRQVVIPVVVH